MKKVLLLFTSLFAIAIVISANPTDCETCEKSPVASETANAAVEARGMWDLLHSFTLTSAGQQGIVTDGNFIYTSSWQATPVGGNSFYKYSLDGTFIEGFDVPGAGEVRDLTYDGEYFYGSSGSSAIYCLDFNNKTLVSTINCTDATTRHCSYDPNRDGFWTGNWTNLYFYNRSGVLQFTAPAPPSAYGSGYFVDADGAEHLYLFCKPNDDCKVLDYNITTNTLDPSPIFDFSVTPGFDEAICGGAFIGEYNGVLAFFGNAQQDPNLVGIYELYAIPQEPTLYYGFEGSLENWTTIDANNDGYTWINTSNIEVWSSYYVGMTLDWYRTGSDAIISASYINQVGALSPDDYIVSPRFAIGDDVSMSFYVAACDHQYPAEHFGVAVSTASNTTPSDFVIVDEWTLTAKDAVRGNARESRDGDGTRLGAWYQKTVDLSAYAGQNIYVAIRHFNCSDQYIMCIDDVAFFGEISVAPIETFTINVSADPAAYGTVTGGGDYDEGATCTIIATPNPGHLFVNWTKGNEVVSTDATYSFTVTENASYTANFQVDGIEELEENLFVIFPNPVNEKLMIKSAETVRQCDVYSVTGSLIFNMTVDSDSFEVQVKDLPAGSYLIRIISDNVVQTKRFIKN